MNESKIPEIWKQADVTAVHKKRRQNQLRKLSTNKSDLSIACKQMERLICNKLVDHMKKKKKKKKELFSPYQHGFIYQEKSCITHLLEILEEITDTLD